MTDLAREYGEGLYELAREEDIREDINEQLKAISAVLTEQPDFIRLLSSRAINLEERIKVVDDTFAGQAHSYIISFMKLLTQRGRIDAFIDCAKWFGVRFNEDFGIVEAHVTTAVALDEDKQAALKQKLDEMTGKNVNIILHVDSSILGGVRVEMNGQRFDNSIQNRLERLKYSLTKSL